MTIEEAKIGELVYRKLFVKVGAHIQEVSNPGVIRSVTDTYAVCDFFQVSDVEVDRVAVEFGNLSAERFI